MAQGYDIQISSLVNPSLLLANIWSEGTKLSIILHGYATYFSNSVALVQLANHLFSSLDYTIMMNWLGLINSNSCYQTMKWMGSFHLLVWIWTLTFIRYVLGGVGYSLRSSCLRGHHCSLPRCLKLWEFTLRQWYRRHQLHRSHINFTTLCPSRC